MSDKTDAIVRNLADAFITALEAGIANPKGWVAPWHSAAFGAVNASTGRPYTGGNTLVLLFSGHSGPWATYRQWEGIGGQVRKGEKGTQILTPKPFTKKDEKTGQEKQGIFFGVATVFAADQQDGWTAPAAAPAPDAAGINERAEEWLAAWREVADVRTAPGRAFFHPTADYVSLPPVEDFHTMDGYYSTAMHEAGHWAAGEARLDQIVPATFGTPLYAREELRAELTSATLGITFGVAGELSDEHRDYLASWVRVVKNDPKELWDAASDAAKRSRYLLALSAPAPAEKEDAALVA
jgi:putative DNA primase/helicase